MSAPYREPIRYADEGPAAASRAIALGPYALQRYRGPVPSEPVRIARATIEQAVAHKLQVDRVIESKKEKRKKAGTRGRRRIYATVAERKAAKKQRQKERDSLLPAAEPKKSGQKSIYANDAERKAARLARARAKYRRDHPARPPAVKQASTEVPKVRRKPGPVPGPKPARIPREYCPHANETKRGFSADGRQKWRCENCGGHRTESPRGPGRPRLEITEGTDTSK